MKLTSIKGRGTATGERHERAPAETPTPGESRALVPLAAAPASYARESTNSRPAAFLAHLIATSEQVPQARERRRADPSEAAYAYQAVAMKRPRSVGRTVSVAR